MNKDYPKPTQIKILESRIEILESNLNYSRDNNAILNRALGKKFTEVDELHAAIRKYNTTIVATNACTDILLSKRGDSSEAADLMQDMYNARTELFLLVGILE